jgi:hypothetical protein
VPELTLQERRHLGTLRAAEALQEIGILLFAFAPLDFLLDLRGVELTGPIVAGAMAIALLLFVLGVRTERRIHDAD